MRKPNKLEIILGTLGGCGLLVAGTITLFQPKPLSEEAIDLMAAVKGRGFPCNELDRYTSAEIYGTSQTRRVQCDGSAQYAVTFFTNFRPLVQKLGEHQKALTGQS